MREAKAVGTKSVVASEAGLGAGASAAETPLVVAIINIATITATKKFIFDASIVVKLKKEKILRQKRLVGCGKHYAAMVDFI
jgi:hypothetical protein